MTAIEKLVGIGGNAFVDHFDNKLPQPAAELQRILGKKNGFFAFESALRVFSTERTLNSYDLASWNSHELWRESYGTLAVGLFFFAEDIFGTQFCLKDGEVHTFEPETADLTLVSASIEGWAAAILDDYDLLTGYPLAHKWQESYGELNAENRLMPKIPFVCGGSFSVDNLFEIESARSMRSRANLAAQIHGAPDGSAITFQLVD